MKNIKSLASFLPVILLICACSKGNEHLSRDLFTPLVPITFNIPVITYVDSSQKPLELKGYINLDSLVKADAGAGLGAADVKSVTLRSLRLDLVTFDTTYNFRLIDSLQVRLRMGTNTTGILAQAISNPDVSTQVLNLPLSGVQPDVKSFINSSGFSYLIRARIRRKTSQPFKVTLTAGYRLTVGN
jgi:hypothetical protein